MSFTPSINIVRDFGTTPNYIVTANARQTIGKIISQYSTGIHSFCLIGSYGTGKSSFILAFENSLLGENSLIPDSTVFDKFTDFQFLNIVGDYKSLSCILSEYLCCSPDNSIHSLNIYYQQSIKNGKFLVIAIDEFGKILEHAAKNNPEDEMYFIQKFCEYINSPKRHIIFLSTLHQGFGAYAKDLKPEQRKEWIKVKGRIQDIVFNEPIEQLLNLTAQAIGEKSQYENIDGVEFLYTLAIDSKLLSNQLSPDVTRSIYPLDIIAAYALTIANQRYGQNERTLFSFLEATGKGSLSEFQPSENKLYNLALVYDYIVYNFYSQIQGVNEDSANWSALKTAIDRVEGQDFSDEEISDSIDIIKAVGMLNIFASATAKIDKDFLITYLSLAMGIKRPSDLIKRLEDLKVLRYAKYKSKYILYEGTDVDIELGLYEAARECKRSENVSERIASLFDFKLVLANANYFETGTPRYFQYIITSTPTMSIPKGEIDGYINLLFSSKDNFSSNKEICLQTKGHAILYGLYRNYENIVDYLFEIDKLMWVKNNYIADDSDRIANREIDRLIEHEKSTLNNVIIENLFNGGIEWYFNGEKIENIKSQKELNKQLSVICNEIYNNTPKYHFELINKTRPTGNMSLARQVYLQALLDNNDQPDLGFPSDKYPPEKSLFLTLLKNTGMYSTNGIGAPIEETFHTLWCKCEDFLQSTLSKPRRIKELSDLLSEAPFRLKQGLIDCWIPTFLIIKKDDYALYNEDRYIPYINKEVLDLILRSPSSFTIKAFSMDGIKHSFFEKYREAINLSSTTLTTTSFIETIRPFLTFYKQLNSYAKRTKDISSNARKFRDIIANASDPERTFFEFLPDQLGFKEIVLTQNPESIECFVNVIHDAIRDLRSCYDEFIKSIESNILYTLRIENKDFDTYITEINNRYRYIKYDLMPMTLRNFHTRLTGNYDNRRMWIEAICYVVLNKPLSEIKDGEKTGHSQMSVAEA